MYTSISQCRICGNSSLAPVVDLGTQVLTGVFPKRRDEKITQGPLQLLKCDGDDACGLLQLAHSYDPVEMYGDNYGYRSGLNPSMVKHLHRRIAKLREWGHLAEGDLVIDIGANDGTSLRAYSPGKYLLLGVDPTARKFREFYPPGIDLVTDFFSAALVREKFPGKRAKVVTSFSMLYDLEAPLDFFREVHSILDQEGIWVFEQSYMPIMLESNSFDTVCHEHIEYYGLKQIKWMADRTGFKIIDVETNDVNGGSFAVTVARAESHFEASPEVELFLRREHEAGLDTLEPYLAFAERARRARNSLLDFLRKAREEGKVVAALGASTKGNVLLQYCQVTEEQIAFVGEVNADKFGSFTPGTLLPIVPESDVLSRQPDYVIVLPWHFRDFFVRSAKFEGLNLVFPLPALEVVAASAR